MCSLRGELGPNSRPTPAPTPQLDPPHSLISVRSALHHSTQFHAPVPLLTVSEYSMVSTVQSVPSIRVHFSSVTPCLQLKRVLEGKGCFTWGSLSVPVQAAVRCAVWGDSYWMRHALRQGVFTLVTSSCFLAVNCSFFDVNVKI